MSSRIKPVPLLPCPLINSGSCSWLRAVLCPQGETSRGEMYNLFFSDAFVVETPNRLLTWGTTQVLFVTTDMVLSSPPGT